MKRRAERPAPVEQIDLTKPVIAEVVITWPKAPNGDVYSLRFKDAVSDLSMPAWVALADALRPNGYQLTMSTEVREARIL